MDLRQLHPCPGDQPLSLQGCGSGGAHCSAETMEVYNLWEGPSGVVKGDQSLPLSRELSGSHFLPIFIPFQSEAGQDLCPLSRWEGEDPGGGRVCTLPKLNLGPVTPGSHRKSASTAVGEPGSLWVFSNDVDQQKSKLSWA